MEQPVNEQPKTPESTGVIENKNESEPVAEELGVCEVEIPETKLQGIDLIMSIVENIYQDKTLQPLLSQEAPPKKRMLFKTES